VPKATIDLSATLLLQGHNVGVVPSKIPIKLAEITLNTAQPAAYVLKANIHIVLNGIEAGVVVNESNKNQQGWDCDTEQQLKVRHVRFLPSAQAAGTP
jgi:hypothetical protein